MSVRVRFAPSPTGYLHVGGARTAIFNWLFARHHGGVFVLRIEDTDAARSSDELVAAILDGMAWLGLDADEGPHFQSAERVRHVADADRLIGSGHAYRDFTPPDRAQEIREQAQAAGGSYRSPDRDLPLEVSRARAQAGEACAVRFRVPAGRIEWDDIVHRRTGFEASTIEDFVLLRSDRSPTYMLSVVSDDIAMEITHVIRGDDHISNTPKQILLYEALGRPLPRFAHLPLILGEDKKRLSKRHGAVSVLEYRDQGYLPEAMLNFLALLGWAPSDGQEKMDRDALVEEFDLGGVGRSGAIFDLKKLDWLNGEYLAHMDPVALTRLVRPALEQAGLWRAGFDGEERERLHEVLRLLQGRARRVEEFVTYGRPYLDPSDELEYEPGFASKHLKGEQLADDLRALLERLRGTEHWNGAALEAALREVAEQRGLSAGKLIHPTRLAVTGMGVGPGIFDVLCTAGRERALARLERLVNHLDGQRAPSR